MNAAQGFIEGKPIVIGPTGAYWAVTESADPDLGHLWMGVEVDKIGSRFIPKRPVYGRLLRAADCTVIR